MKIKWDISVYNQAGIYHDIHGAPQFYQMTDRTLIIAVKNDGGIKLAADLRLASSAMVGNKFSCKLDPIHQRFYCQRSGTTTHTNTIAKCIRYYIDIKA
jgi:20S proteasome subunit beta 1